MNIPLIILVVIWLSFNLITLYIAVTFSSLDGTAALLALLIAHACWGVIIYISIKRSEE